MAEPRPDRPTPSRQNSAKKRPLVRRRRADVRQGEALEARRVLAAPGLANISDVTLSAGAPLNIALDGSDPEGQNLRFEVTSDNPDVIPVLGPSSNRSWRIDVANFGVMTFQLFEDLAPRTTGRIIGLTNQGFYNNLIFHRVIDNFVIQGGDPLGTGSGGSTLPNFDDEFNVDLQHTSSGLLSFAKTSDDTNNSQFFVTDAPTRHLDFNHSIFGFLTEGEAVRDRINSVQTGSGDRPLTPITMRQVEIFQDQQNGVLRLKTRDPGVSGSANITVRVIDSAGESSTRTFRVTVQPDSTNNHPFIDTLNPITIGADRVPVTIPVRAFDAEGDRVRFLILGGDPSQLRVDVDSTGPTPVGQVATANVTITPINNTVGGIFELFVNVQANTGGSQQNSDLQRVPLIITPLAPRLRLLPGQDTGIDGDNITRNNLLQFEVTDVLEDAEIVLRDGNNVIGTFRAGHDTDMEPNETTTHQFTLTSPLSDGVHNLTITQAVTRATLVNYRDVRSPESPQSQNFAITVLNAAPRLDVPTSDVPASAGLPLTIDIGSDREGIPGSVYSLLSPPQGMTINPTTGVISWTPPTTLNAIQRVRVRLDDAAGNNNEATFNINVQVQNRPPSFTPISRPSIREETFESFNISADDPDVASGDVLTYSFVGSVPAGANLEPNQGVFSWRPTEDQGGSTYTFNVRAIDSGGLEANTTFTIRVDEFNVAPVLAAINDQFVIAGAMIRFNVAATDTDLPANTLSYSLKAGAPAGAAINPTTGEFTFTVPSSSTAQTFAVTVVVDDGQGGMHEESFSIEVNVAPDLPPIADRSVDENTTFNLDVDATDGNATDQITYSLTAAPTGATIDAATGRILWTPGEQDGGQAFTFTVRAVDLGGLEDTSTFNVTVVEVDDAPVFGTVSPLFRVNLGQPFELALSAADPDNPADTITYSLVSGPNGAAVDPATGRFTFQSVTGQAPGRVTVRVRAEESDGRSAETTFDIVMNGPPVLRLIGNRSIDELNQLIITLDISDPNSADDELAFSFDDAPAGMTIDPSTGRIEWTPTEAQGAGLYDVRVKVTDLAGATATQLFVVTVNEVANAPIFEPVPNQQVVEGDFLEVQLVASDSDPSAGALVYSLISGPNGAAVDPNSGLFSWSPGEADGPTAVTVTVRVTDDTGLNAQQSFTINVSEQNDPPFLDDEPSATVREGELLERFFTATDFDLPANTLQFSLASGAPSGATIDAATGRFRWTPSLSQGGRSYSIDVIVTDSAGGSDTSTFSVTVTERAIAVRIRPVDDQSIGSGQSFSRTIEIDDPNAGLAGNPEFRLVDAPAGATIDPITGLLRFTPDAEATGPFNFTVEVQIGGNDGPVSSESFQVRITSVSVDVPIGNVDSLPALFDAYDDIAAVLGASAPSGLAQSMLELRRGLTPTAVSRTLPLTANFPQGNGSLAAGAPSLVSFPDTGVNPITRPGKPNGTDETKLDESGASSDGSNSGVVPASGTDDQSSAREDESSKPLGSRNSPTNVRPTSSQSRTEDTPLKTAESARDRAVSEFDRTADLKPASSRLAWYTGTHTTVPRPVLLWTESRGQTVATPANLSGGNSDVAATATRPTFVRPVGIGEASVKSTPPADEAARDALHAQSAAETQPAEPKQAATKPATAGVRAATAVAMAAYMPMLVNELKRGDDDRSWRRWLR